jgi:hypothetical protein
MALDKTQVQDIIKLKLQDEKDRREGKGTSNANIAEQVLGSRSAESSVRRIFKEYKNSGSYRGFSDEVVSIINVVVPPTSTKIFNVKKDVYNIETVQKVGSNVTHLMIPDTQVKPNISLDYLDWLGSYIVDKKPEVIVHIGDHFDFPSLSSYDKGKGSAEGRRVQADIEAGIEGMNRILKPLYELQQQQLSDFGKVLYKPKMVFTIGNHCERLMRHVDENPELIGFLSYDNLRLKCMGWEVIDYLKPVVINGVAYCHFMANPMTGKPYGGAALSILKNVGESFCMGHKQLLDVATRFLPASGRQIWSVIAGAYYEHEESYKGPQGNHHYRGIVIKDNVVDGNFNLSLMSLETMRERYGS